MRNVSGLPVTGLPATYLLAVVDVSTGVEESAKIRLDLARDPQLARLIGGLQEEAVVPAEERRIGSGGSAAPAPALASGAASGAAGSGAGIGQRSNGSRAGKAGSVYVTETGWVDAGFPAPPTRPSSRPSGSCASRPRCRGGYTGLGRRRRLAKRRDGQDRRPLLLLQGDRTHAPPVPEWVPLVGPESATPTSSRSTSLADAIDHISHQPGLDGTPST